MARHDMTRHDTTRHDTLAFPCHCRATCKREGEGRARRRKKKDTRKESKRGEEKEGRGGEGTKMIRGSRENASYRDESGTWTLDGFTCARFYALRNYVAIAWRTDR